jgi:hypothetical protein
MVLGFTELLTEMRCGRCEKLTISPTSVSRISLESVGSSTSHNPMGLHDLTRIALTFYFYTLFYEIYTDETSNLAHLVKMVN